MGGVNSMIIAQAVINALGSNKYKKGDRKPPARWRSPEEFKRLSNEGKCTRCCNSGHGTRVCPTYGPAKKPTSISHIKGSNLGSGKLEPINDIPEEEISDEVFSGED